MDQKSNFVKDQSQTRDIDIKTKLCKDFKLKHNFVDKKLEFKKLKEVYDYLQKRQDNHKPMLSQEEIIPEFNKNSDTQKWLRKQFQQSPEETSQESTQVPKTSNSIYKQEYPKTAYGSVN